MHGSLHKQRAALKKFRAWTNEDLELYERVVCAHAREDFYAYRKMINRDLTEGWFQKEVAVALEDFWADWQAGLTPVLVLEAPPQHGKSSQVTDFISWASGKNPDLKTIYASYSEDLGLKANMALQRIYDQLNYQKVFPNTRLSDTNVVTMSHRYARNSFHLEYVGHRGEFRNTTVNGQITGMGLELGVIDDPMKGRAESSSLTIRDKTWGWFTDDFFSRFTETAALLMIMTRWHLDDPVGRFLERYPHARHLKYPALGRMVDGQWIADDENGEPLFPELKSKKFLLKRKRLMAKSSWVSLYQQSPVVVGGDQFPIEKITIIDVMPSQDQIKRSVRYWDKAGSKKRSETASGQAATAGVLMHELFDGRFVVEDVVRGWWKSAEREMRIKQTAVLDNEHRRVETWVEQEPGSGGKESAENTIKNLRGFRVYADRVTGAKEIRCEPYAAQVQVGNVSILKASKWNKAFLDEHEVWPNGKAKDQVDAAGGAFVKLTVRESRYDSSMRWATGGSGDEDSEAE